MTKVHIPDIKPHRSGLRLLLDIRRDPLAYFTNMMVEEGSFTWLKIGGRLVLVLNDATAIEHVLQINTDNYHKAHFVNVLRPLLGDGIFLTEDETWKKQRHEASPVFATKKFEDMIPPMIAATDNMLKRWEPRIERGELIDFTLETMGLTLDILLRALFHESKENVAEDMQKNLGIILREAESRIWAPASVPQSIVHALPKYSKAMRFLNETIDELIQVRKKQPAYSDDLLSRLIHSYGDTPSEQRQLHAQVMSFVLAGHETTSHGLSWTFYNLGLHPQQLQRVVEEADSICGDEPPTLALIKKMTYTRQVFDEALRHYPPVWTMSREAVQEDILPLDDGSCVRLPAGTTIMLCGYSVHRRENYWQNPEAFDPDRFSPEIAASRPKFAWFPFGGGRRLCLGMQFAQVESILAIAMIVRKYKMSLVPGQSIKPLPIITLRPNKPMLFRITNRKEKISTARPSGLPMFQTSMPAKCPFHSAAE